MMAMPEEQNRRLTDHIATWLFCPTKTAIDNLAKEGIVHNVQGEKASADNKYVIQTGDIMYDASLYYRKKASASHIKSENIYGFNENFLLLTIHRVENTNNLERLKAIAAGINSVKDKNFVFPVHPRTKSLVAELCGQYQYKNILFVQPLGYLDMLYFVKHAKKAITDSGGLQKETYILDTACVTVRDQTEGVETLIGNHNVLAKPDANDILDKVMNITIDWNAKQNYYGTGHAAKKICDLIG